MFVAVARDLLNLGFSSVGILSKGWAHSMSEDKVGKQKPYSNEFFYLWHCSMKCANIEVCTHKPMCKLHAMRLTFAPYR